MKQLPSHRLQPASAWQQQQLQLWLAEWQADRTLAEPPASLGPLTRTDNRGATSDSPPREVEDPEPDAVPEPVERVERGPGQAVLHPNRQPLDSRAGAVDPEPTLVVRQIRLLRPGDAAGADRPLYVALLQDQSPAAWRVAPFHRFAEPAVPGEWRTGRNEPPLRVLCLWNARLLAAPALQRSWWVGELSDTEFERAQQVWLRWQPDQAAPVELEHEVGPPLVHPLDPRWEYLEEETRLAGGWSASLPPAARTYPEAAEHENIELALAAETRSPYAVTSYQVGGLPLQIRVSPGTEPATRRVQLVDDQNRVVTRLDGSVLARPDGARSGALQQGTVQVPADWIVTGLTLLEPTGTVHRLLPS